ncbi:MAG: RNA polymerase sigma factor [Bacteroidaceae bacterium]|nr:RNA polymerase sigma factor [Bacteroidaceae bacterium]
MKMINFRDDVLPLKNRLYRLALRITLDTLDAEDIVQETLIRVWNMREDFDKIDSIEAFSLTICRNLALDHISRKESQNEQLDESYDTTPDVASTPLQALLLEDKRSWVMKLFNELPEKQRSVMQLRDIEGKSYREIAQVLGFTEEQVKVTLFRARQHIRQEFEKIDNYGL